MDRRRTDSKRETGCWLRCRPFKTSVFGSAIIITSLSRNKRDRIKTRGEFWGRFAAGGMEGGISGMDTEKDLEAAAAKGIKGCERGLREN